MMIPSACTCRTLTILLLTVVLSTLFIAEPVRAQDGQQIYQQYCSVCHGDKGDGQSRARQGLIPPPRDFTEPDMAASLTRYQMLAAVSSGITGTAMTGWQTRLSEAEIHAVVDYVRQQFMRVNIANVEPQASHGRDIYMNYCSVCHGDDGGRARWTGAGLNPPPRKFTDPTIRTTLSRKSMVAVVTHGKPNTAMVGFNRQLDDQDIDAVVDYIRNAFMQLSASDTGEAKPPEQQTHGHSQGHSHDEETGELKNIALMPMPNGLNGDKHAGAAFYRDNCATCHGVDGNGDGPRAYFISPKPVAFTDDAHRAHLDRPALFEGIRDGVRGREMPAWGKVLNDQQIADVAEYVFTQFIQPNDTHSEHAQQ